MGRSRFLLILAGILVAALVLPAAAAAGTYAWDLPANFTTTPPGANPDHDSYGGAPWSYLESPPGLSMPPSSFTRLPTFGGSCGPATWCDASPGLTKPAIGAASGALVMTASATRPVAVGWTSPFPSAHAVTLADTVTAGGCPAPEFEDASGNALSGTVSVPAGGTVYFVVRPPTIGLTGCSSSVTIHITGSAVAPPGISLQSPANGAQITGSQPRFTGTASTGFGSSPALTVRVYSGPSAGGTPVQTLHAFRSSTGAFSASLLSALRDGQYTARAEQDDLSTPADVGLSNPTTFAINNAPPQVRGPVKIGPRVKISKAGTVSVPVKCLATGSVVCSGDVLILTQRNFRPRPGGASGQIRVMFAYVSIPAGRTQVVKRSMPKDIAAFLLRRKFVRLRFGSTLMAAHG